MLPTSFFLTYPLSGLTSFIFSQSYACIHPPAHAHPSIHPLTYKSTYSSNSTVDGSPLCLVIHLCTICCSDIHLPIYLSIHIISHQSIYSFIHRLSICPSIHSATTSLPSHPFNDPRIHLPIHLATYHQAIYLSIQSPMDHPSLHPCMLYSYTHSDNTLNPTLSVSPETRMVTKNP